MDETLIQTRQHLTQGLSRVSNFWGFPKAMGAIYATLYLSPEPLSLDDLVKQVGVTKGAVSTNVRMLERLGMVHKQVKIGERKDYYEAETDFWKIARGILKEREKSEFDRALLTVDESLEMAQSARPGPEDAGLALFYQQRLQGMLTFFQALDNLVATILALDELRQGTIQRLFGKLKDE
jgi:DNA-binding transcriptional regulator GbsR (MarR family)